MADTRHRVSPVTDPFPYKVELHVHLDGAVRLGTLLDIARNRKHHLCDKSPDELRQEICVYHAKSLHKCLASFAIFMPIVAGDRDAISRFAYEFCEDCAANNIRYVEARYSPHLLANSEDRPEYAQESGDLPPREVVLIVNDAFKRGMASYNIRVKSILCCMRHRPDWSDEVVQLANEFRSDGVVGIDIAGGSVQVEDAEFIDDEHKVAFKRAKDLGLRITAHAGESGPPQKLIEAVEELYAERIGHGYSCVLDDTVYSEVRRLGVHLETCPISSVCTGAVSEDPRKHPIIRFVRDGVSFSVNSDDPLLFDSCILDDYMATRQMGLTDDQIIQSIFNAARSCFAPEDEKKEILRELVSVYGDKYNYQSNDNKQ